MTDLLPPAKIADLDPPATLMERCAGRFVQPAAMNDFALLLRCDFLWTSAGAHPEGVREDARRRAHMGGRWDSHADGNLWPF